jgi:hypothetical protein
MAMEWDIDRELIGLDTCLADFEHPVSAAVRKRALALAAGIVAGAPEHDRPGVALRLEITLSRHGITHRGEAAETAPDLHQRRSTDLTEGRSPPR